jgi:small-conductance mechanosensitive channel
MKLADDFPRPLWKTAYYNRHSGELMKNTERAIFAGLVILLVAALAAAVLTRKWGNYHEHWRTLRTQSARAAAIVDTRELDTAQQLSQLAVTHTERDYAEQALHDADHSVDVAFDAALRDAADNPPPLTPQTRDLTARIQAADAVLDVDQNRVADLQQQLAKARPAQKDDVQAQLDFAQEQLSLHQEELDDAHQDLIRAGGDKKAIIQQQLDQHNASEAHAGKAGAPTATTNEADSLEMTTSSSIRAEAEALFSLRSKEQLLRQAQQSALARAAEMSGEHETLQKEVDAEKAQKRILHHSRAGAPAGAAAATQAQGADQEAAANGNGAIEAPSALSLVQHLKSEQQDLSQLNKRMQDEQELAALYGNWATFVDVREKAFVHELILSIFWILLIAVCVLVANASVQRFFSDVTPEHRELHTMRTVAMVVIQALGVALILLVIFGVPNNFATFLALATAGITVALKDFIVGFVGWFVLMGKDGIRPGDWVEINGVGGEVLEVGLFRTTLLETGNWSDAAHPTGRKVAFVNSYAIEGHYFNFSTSGQWLWDELQIQVPSGIDPYTTAESIKKIAADETAPNAQQAEEEWTRVVPVYAKRKFSASPSMSVTPAGGGVNVTVRYITRVRDRQEVRTRLYRSVVELLHGKETPEGSAAPLPAET